THLDDLYFTLFKPHATDNAWKGNLKKYKLKFSTDASTGVVTPFIADKDGNAAVDPNTGYFSDQSWSYWSAEMDKKAVNKGGAASMMNNVTDGRKVYTITGTMADGDTVDGVYVPAVGSLIATENRVVSTNDSLTDALLGSTDKASILTDANAAAIPYRTTLINWAAGLDVFSDYGAVNTTDDARLEMADPLHAEPALVQYGQTDGVPDLVAYVATNNGYLHAIDVDDGKEVFSFIPQDLLTKLPRVMENNGGNKTYGLDGSVIAWIHDDNGDNSITTDGDDHVYLYFGMRRGGKNIYALDVTDRANPRFMWEIKGGIGDYAELGETWSTINVEKIKDGTTEK
ncbi:MAG: PQQ-binding-like beta-propeller repeat protein, partial [Gammaproteobacteria bacterium]|nr:PQQ-binding-like beta-propeller repeat protein [Gammaproteobacteria bacterium]